MLGPGFGFNPTKATRAEFGFKFDLCDFKSKRSERLNLFDPSKFDSNLPSET